MLTSCVGADNYTIYHLKHDTVTDRSPWKQNCQLLVIAVERVSVRSVLLLCDIITVGSRSAAVLMFMILQLVLGRSLQGQQKFIC